MLYQILCNATPLFSGSHTLHILLPPATTSWEANDLDVYYVTAARAGQMINLLRREGWHLAAAHDQAGDEYATSSVQQVLSFLRHDHRIDAIVSAMDAEITPVFEFHSKCHLFCLSDPVVVRKINSQPVRTLSTPSLPTLRELGAQMHDEQGDAAIL